MHAGWVSILTLCWNQGWLHMPFTQEPAPVLSFSLILNYLFSVPLLSYIFCMLSCGLRVSCFFAQLLKSTVNNVFRGHCLHQLVFFAEVSLTQNSLFVFMKASKLKCVYFLKAQSSALCPWPIAFLHGDKRPSSSGSYSKKSWVGHFSFPTLKGKNNHQKNLLSIAHSFFHNKVGYQKLQLLGIVAALALIKIHSWNMYLNITKTFDKTFQFDKTFHLNWQNGETWTQCSLMT